MSPATIFQNRQSMVTLRDWMADSVTGRSLADEPAHGGELIENRYPRSGDGTRVAAAAGGHRVMGRAARAGDLDRLGRHVSGRALSLVRHRGAAALRFRR